MKEVSIFPVGEQALSICFGNKPDKEINDQVFSLYNHLRRQADPFWKDLIPAYCTLTVVYDLKLVRSHSACAFTYVKNSMEQALEKCIDDEGLTFRKLLIPVCYESAFGLDLPALAKSNRISVDEIIERHTAPTYRVYMLGFLPGFPYMGMVPDAIAAPRLATPRRTVSAGSVGIAGNQTGIYPMDSPGGWNIIGRTPVKLFDVHAKQPVLFQPGDEVTFYPITQEAFDAFDAFDARSFNPISA
ncbi:MAG: 5-oxoprolinase subunit PxpB [Cyclobacteriaceae bacterium]|nr:5-oxoprolinase subunit PxpB [Cyclobacteriaceae bacterium]